MSTLSRKHLPEFNRSLKCAVLALSTFTILSLPAQAQRDRIKIPFFEPLTKQDLCGRDECYPNINTAAYVSRGMTYTGNPASVLGRKSRLDIFNTSPCVRRPPTGNDIDTLSVHNLTGKLEQSKKREFDTKVSADLAKIVNSQINLPANAKADLLAQIERTVSLKTNQEIELQYKDLQLKQEYLDSEISACYGNLERGYNVITGISLITVRGAWSSDALLDAFKKFEANGALFNALSADTKAEYERSKSKILKGNFDALSLIISHSYRYKGRRA